MSDQPTQQLDSPTRFDPAPRVQVSERAREGGGARPPADWGKRSQIAGFVLLLLLIANVLVADLLVARSLLGWHG